MRQATDNPPFEELERNIREFIRPYRGMVSDTSQKRHTVQVSVTPSRAYRPEDETVELRVRFTDAKTQAWIETAVRCQLGVMHQTRILLLGYWNLLRDGLRSTSQRADSSSEKETGGSEKAMIEAASLSHYKE